MQGKEYRPAGTSRAGGILSVHPREFTEQGLRMQASISVHISPFPSYPGVQGRHNRPVDAFKLGGGRSTHPVEAGEQGKLEHASRSEKEGK